jgi:hypothetical protein
MRQVYARLELLDVKAEIHCTPAQLPEVLQTLAKTIIKKRR